MRILVVDDSKAARMLVKSILTEYDSGSSFIEASNGKEAVELYKKELPDFVFMDLTMPVMDGFEALRLIKTDFPEAVVVVLTADIQEKSITKCMDSGAYTVIRKLPQKDVVFKLLDDIREKLGRR